MESQKTGVGGVLINIELITEVDGKSRQIRVPADRPVSALIQHIVSDERFNLRELDEDGYLLPYRISWRGTVLRPRDTLSRSGVESGQSLTLSCKVLASESESASLAYLATSTRELLQELVDNTRELKAALKPGNNLAEQLDGLRNLIEEHALELNVVREQFAAVVAPVEHPIRATDGVHVFVSHCHTDRPAAQALVDLLVAAGVRLAGCGRTLNFRWRFSEHVDRWTPAAAIEAALLS